MLHWLRRVVRYGMLRKRPVLGCLAGVLIGTAGVGAQLGIETNAGVWIGTFPFAYAAALLSTIVGDLNGGIASLLVGGVGIWYFLIEPHYSFNIRMSTDEVGLLLFFGIGLLIIASTHLML